MNYNILFSRFVRSYSKTINKPPLYCFAIFKEQNENEICDCVDICKYSPPTPTNNPLFEINIDSIPYQQVQQN